MRRRVGVQGHRRAGALAGSPGGSVQEEENTMAAMLLVVHTALRRRWRGGGSGAQTTPCRDPGRCRWHREQGDAKQGDDGCARKDV
jgi:hypothetical protein